MSWAGKECPRLWGCIHHDIKFQEELQITSVVIILT
jgi:hypothetical protein